MTINYTQSSVSSGLTGHDHCISIHQSHCAASFCFLYSHLLAFTLLYRLQIFLILSLIYCLTASTIKCPLPYPLRPFLHPPRTNLASSYLFSCLSCHNYSKCAWRVAVLTHAWLNICHIKSSELIRISTKTTESRKQKTKTSKLIFQLVCGLHLLDIMPELNQKESFSPFEF